MANQLAIDKVLAIKYLQQTGYSERKIAEQLGVSRKAVRSHLGRTSSKDTKALTGSGAASGSPAPTSSASLSHGFRDTIIAKLDQGLTAQRIFQDLQTEHGFAAKYHSVRRYIAKLRQSTELPFRRLEREPGAELQVDFGTWVRWNSRVLRVLNSRMEVIATHCTRDKGRFSTVSEQASSCETERCLSQGRRL